MIGKLPAEAVQSTQRDAVTRHGLNPWLLFAVGWLSLCSAPPAEAVDWRIVPLWDGETSSTPDGDLINRFGGPVVHQGAARTLVSRVTGPVHAGMGAYRVHLTEPIVDYAFFQLALSGFGPTPQYVMSRDLNRFENLCFWCRNGTGKAFTLKVEIKDDRDTNDHVAFRRFSVPADARWRQICVSVRSTAGWTVVGQPDFDRARFIGFVFETTPNQPLAGDIFFDDVQLIESGRPADVQSVNSTELLTRLARRQFEGLWGSRSREHGLIPLNSVYADVAALNSTAAVVKTLPTAVKNGWVSAQTANDYLSQLVSTLNTLMDASLYLPPRYVDWLTLESDYIREESPVDAALLALALYQYQGQPSTPPPLRADILALLGRFNFEAFATPQGWKLAYLPDTQMFTAGTYDGYSGEIWLMCLAAHLMPNHSVDIATLYHTGTHRVRDYCFNPNWASVVHEDDRFRAPFTQWLFPTYVNVQNRGVDTYPDPELATNPYANALLYQRDAIAYYQSLGRVKYLQPDAGDDGTGMKYEQFSCYNNFGEPYLYMPWSATCCLTAHYNAAVASIRFSLQNGLHTPYGLADSVVWPPGASKPTRLTARADFWNVGLSTMYLTQHLYNNAALLTNLAPVQAALNEVYLPPDLATTIGAALARPLQAGERLAHDAGVRIKALATAAPELTPTPE